MTGRFNKRSLTVAFLALLLILGIAAANTTLGKSVLSGEPDPDGFVKSTFGVVTTPNPATATETARNWQDLLQHQDPKSSTNLGR